MAKPIVAFDIDDILNDFYPSFAQYHNQVYGSIIKKEGLHVFEIATVFNLSPSESLARINAFCETEQFSKLIPLLGAQKGIDMVKEFADVVAITSRASNFEHVTKKWITQHFPEKFSQVVLANLHGDGKKMNKSELCKLHGAQVMVEDSLKYALDCASNGIPTVLLDKPWNKGIVPNNVIRVNSWSEIPVALRKLL